jgi:hypothetical protein
VDVPARCNSDSIERCDVVEPIKMRDKLSMIKSRHSRIAIILFNTCLGFYLHTAYWRSIIAQMRKTSRALPPRLKCHRLPVSVGLCGLPGRPIVKAPRAPSRRAVVRRRYHIARGRGAQQAFACGIGVGRLSSPSEESRVERFKVRARSVSIHVAFQLRPFSQVGK